MERMDDLLAMQAMEEQKAAQNASPFSLLRAPEIALPTAPKVNPKKERLAEKMSGKSEMKKATSSGVWDQELTDPVLDRARALPEFQRAEAGIKEIDDLIGMERARPESNTGWISPLLALTDAQTGSNFRAGYTPKESQSQRIQSLLSEKQKRSENQYKNLMDSVKTFKTGTENNARTQGMMAGMAGAGKGGSGRPSEVDKAYAKKYVEFIPDGGYTRGVQNLNTMAGLINDLETKQGLSGPGVGVLDSMGTLDYVNPEAANFRQKYEQVVQQNLKEILGGQFAQQEAIELMKRAYNPRLPQKDNAERIRAAYQQIRDALEAKRRAAEYFEKNSFSMANYKDTQNVVLGLPGEKTMTVDVTSSLENSLAPAPSLPPAGGTVPTQAAAGGAGQPKKEYSKSRNQTRITYPDGRVEVVDGRQ